MRLLNFFKAWFLTALLAWVGKQRASLLHGSRQVTAVGSLAHALIHIDESVVCRGAMAVGGHRAKGTKKGAVRTEKSIFLGSLIALFMSSAAAAPAFQAAGTAVSSTSDVSVSWPAHAIGDVALLFVESRGNEPANLATANGFAQVPNPQFINSDTGTRITVFWARATSTSMAAPQLTDPGNRSYSQIITYRGVINTGNPWDVTGGGIKTGASTTVTVASVITTVPDTLIVQVASRNNDSAAAAFSNQTNGNLTALTERSDAGTTQGNGGGFSVWDGVFTAAGATGATSAVVTSSENAFLTIALKPQLPLVGKSFNPATIEVGATSTLTISLTNSSSTAATGAAFTDAYPANMFNAATPGAATTCGGTVTAAANGTSLALSGGTIPAGGSCAVTVSITSNVAGNYLNSTGPLTTTNAGNGLAATASLIVTMTLRGRVFEDVNYGGGAGRSVAASGGAPVPAARVELFNSGGTFVTSTLTNVSGDYSFAGLAAGNHTVRVVNSTVVSSRAGAVATLLPVQTYRTNGLAANVGIADSARVGGEAPQLIDAGNGSTTLTALATATTTPQSITPVFVGTANITGIDFGFNFDTIVSTRDTGQGSLRQFIVNSNALTGEGSLAQSGLPAGVETSVFMIPNGQANPGHHTGYANQLTTAGANTGAAVITLATVLPTLTGASTRLDATTQTANVRATPGGAETNSGTVGTGGTVGVSANALPLFNRPEVVIYLNNTQIIADGGNVVFKGFAAEYGGLRVNGSTSQVLDTLVGMRADGTVASIYGATFGLTAGAGTNILLSHNYVKVNNSGIRGNSPGANLIIEFNEVDAPSSTPGGGHSSTFDGILIVDSATNISVRNNLAKNQRGGGIEFGFGTGAVTGAMTNNTVTLNGFTSAGVASTELMGVAAYNLAAGTAITMSLNIITSNSGAGILVMNSSGIVISQNSISDNLGLGIDLDPRSIDPNGLTTLQGLTLNDLNDADTGPNGLLNYPILSTAAISGGNLTLTGFARPGSVIELFVAAPDPSGFGEGQTYRTTLTEGSAADTDAGTGTYGPAAINGILQGTDNTNRFNFTITIPVGVVVGTVLTATGTLGGNTSEFSGNVIVTGAPSLVFLKTVAVFSDPSNGITNPKNIPGALVDYTLRVTNTGAGSVTANSIVIVDPIPAGTELFVNSLGASPANSPVAFVNSVTPPSGVTFAFTSLNNTPTADDIEFSNQAPVAGVYTFSYVPVPNALGVDPAVTAIRLNPRGTMAGASGGNNPFFDLRFRVRVK